MDFNATPTWPTRKDTCGYNVQRCLVTTRRLAQLLCSLGPAGPRQVAWGPRGARRRCNSVSAPAPSRPGEVHDHDTLPGAAVVAVHSHHDRHRTCLSAVGLRGAGFDLRDALAFDAAAL